MDAVERLCAGSEDEPQPQSPVTRLLDAIDAKLHVSPNDTLELTPTFHAAGQKTAPTRARIAQVTAPENAATRAQFQECSGEDAMRTAVSGAIVATLCVPDARGGRDDEDAEDAEEVSLNVSGVGALEGSLNVSAEDDSGEAFQGVSAPRERGAGSNIFTDRSGAPQMTIVTTQDAAGSDAAASGSGSKSVPFEFGSDAGGCASGASTPDSGAATLTRTRSARRCLDIGSAAEAEAAELDMSRPRVPSSASSSSGSTTPSSAFRPLDQDADLSPDADFNKATFDFSSSAALSTLSSSLGGAAQGANGGIHRARSPAYAQPHSRSPLSVLANSGEHGPAANQAPILSPRLARLKQEIAHPANIVGPHDAALSQQQQDDTPQTLFPEHAAGDANPGGPNKFHASGSLVGVHAPTANPASEAGADGATGLGIRRGFPAPRAITQSQEGNFVFDARPSGSHSASAFRNRNPSPLIIAAGRAVPPPSLAAGAKVPEGTMAPPPFPARRGSMSCRPRNDASISKNAPSSRSSANLIPIIAESGDASAGSAGAGDLPPIQRAESPVMMASSFQSRLKRHHSFSAKATGDVSLREQMIAAFQEDAELSRRAATDSPSFSNLIGGGCFDDDDDDVDDDDDDGGIDRNDFDGNLGGNLGGNGNVGGDGDRGDSGDDQGFVLRRGVSAHCGPRGGGLGLGLGLENMSMGGNAGRARRADDAMSVDDDSWILGDLPAGQTSHHFQVTEGRFGVDDGNSSDEDQLLPCASRSVPVKLDIPLPKMRSPAAVAPSAFGTASVSPASSSSASPGDSVDENGRSKRRKDSHNRRGGDRPAERPSLSPERWEPANAYKLLLTPLPRGKSKHPDLNCICPQTAARLIRGDFSETIKKFIFIDARFSYEYRGGHITNAINLVSESDIDEYFFNNAMLNKDVVLVFHCEFSSHRGPRLARHLREKDRQKHINTYPELSYPNVFILQTGYKGFFENSPTLCEPQAYVPMRDREFLAECTLGLRTIRVKKTASKRALNARLGEDDDR